MSDTPHALNGPHFVVTAEGDMKGEDTPENRDLVRRIHACVNACEGISTEELESGVIQDMRRVIAQVIPILKQRDEAPSASQPQRKVVARSTKMPEMVAEGAD